MKQIEADQVNIRERETCPPVFPAGLIDTIVDL
jgi:hypothetical protein